MPPEQKAAYAPPSDVNTDTLTYLKSIRSASYKIPDEKIADKFYDISEVLTSVLNFKNDYTLNDADFPLLINDYIPKIAQIAAQQCELYAKTKKQNELDDNCAKMLPILINLSDAMYEMYDQVMKNVGQNIAAECKMLDKSLMYDGFINEFEISMKK